RDWWARATYNIGIACGPSGLIVIDLDLPHDVAEDDEEAAGGALFPLSGADILSGLATQHGERYPGGTYIVDTPSGGCHLYFSAAGDARVRNSAGAVGPHIDVRADGGYVVGAGSRIGGGPRAGPGAAAAPRGARPAAPRRQRAPRPVRAPPRRRPRPGTGVRDGGAAGGEVAGRRRGSWDKERHA